eukprot:CAMPEP_0172001714 /NCGR_PEP_ID=MMETSP1041-20130122/3019_1 /TAXON_ID=464988 /ORGANISM="Hemiselmis andersenii, Strain CCMP439" /LENGTH=145 /DNA_ID=CAMNT_0012655377 /DNA_START=35 /DNA_END=473 /DNA_ORIENTATION=-
MVAKVALGELPHKKLRSRAPTYLSIGTPIVDSSSKTQSKHCRQLHRDIPPQALPAKPVTEFNVARVLLIRGLASMDAILDLDLHLAHQAVDPDVALPVAHGHEPAHAVLADNPPNLHLQRNVAVPAGVSSGPSGVTVEEHLKLEA